MPALRAQHGQPEISPHPQTTPLRPPFPARCRRALARIPRAVTWRPVHAVTRHREVMGFGGKKASIASDSFVAPSANIVGDVTIGPKSAVWYGAVVLGTMRPPPPSHYSAVVLLIALHTNPRTNPRRRRQEE